GRGTSHQQPTSDRRRHRQGHVWQHLSLRYLLAHSRSDQAGGARTGRLTMLRNLLTSQTAESANGVSRRAFFHASAAGSGLMLSLSLPVGEAEAADAFVPNAFVRIDSDGQIVLTMPYVEMGQGTYTSISMLIAEELEVNLQQIRVEHAPPNA